MMDFVFITKSIIFCVNAFGRPPRALEPGSGWPRSVPTPRPLLQQDGEEGLQIHIAEIVMEVERAQTAPQCVLPEGEPLQAL